MPPLNSQQRVAISGLILSASAFVALVVSEGFSPVAYVPTKGDKVTIGHGSTTHLDGSPVKMGDTTTPVKALQRSLAYLDNQTTQLKRCVKVPLHQVEFDTMSDFAYQYGINALCKSSIVALANKGDYAGSCRAYLAYRYAAGYDCSTPGNKRCMGVWIRQQERFKKCMEAQK